MGWLVWVAQTNTAILQTCCPLTAYFFFSFHYCSNDLILQSQLVPRPLDHLDLLGGNIILFDHHTPGKPQNGQSHGIMLVIWPSGGLGQVLCM